MWAENKPDVNNTFKHNTIGCVILANNIALYGGKDTQVTDNVIYDTVTNGGGIHVAHRYPGVKGESGILGTIKIERNTLIRAGNSDFNWGLGVGAIWFDSQNGPMTQAKIHFKDIDIIDSSYIALMWMQAETTGITFENVLINGTGTFVMFLQNAKGEATFKNVTAINVATSNPIHSCIGQAYKYKLEGNNSGWYTDKPDCGPMPKPHWQWE